MFKTCLKFLFVTTSLLFGANAFAELDTTRVVFLSCLKQEREQPLWQEVKKLNPDLILMNGDNVYADDDEVSLLPEAYAKLASENGFAELRKTTPFMATWDDHDYGLNDGGSFHPEKYQAQEMFFDFWGVPQDSPRREQDGIYTSKIIGDEGRRVQVIMLDTRFFRSKLIRNHILRYYTQRYDPSVAKVQEMLGEEQWAWLEDELKKPAEVRLIISSIQFLAENHGFERWATLPKEKQRMFDLLTKLKVNNSVFISGDRHIGELMKVAGDGTGLENSLYDITSSGFNSAAPFYFEQATPMRVGNAIYQDNFGMIEIFWNEESPYFNIQLIGEGGKNLLTEKVLLEV